MSCGLPGILQTGREYALALMMALQKAVHLRRCTAGLFIGFPSTSKSLQHPPQGRRAGNAYNNVMNINWFRLPVQLHYMLLIVELAGERCSTCRSTSATMGWMAYRHPVNYRQCSSRLWNRSRHSMVLACSITEWIFLKHVSSRFPFGVVVFV